MKVVQKKRPAVRTDKREKFVPCAECKMPSACKAAGACRRQYAS